MSELRNLAGSFWSDTNDDASYDVILAAQAEAARQSDEDAKTLKACASIATTPNTRKILVRPLVLKKAADADCWLLPPGVSTPLVITDKLTTAGRLYCQGVEFVTDGDRLYFRVPVPVDDEDFTLWMFGARQECGLVKKIWGLSPDAPRSAELVTVLAEMSIGGTTVPRIRRLLAAMIEAPLTGSADEVVEFVGEDRDGLLVITDRSVYRPHGDCLQVVETGQTVPRYSPLFDDCSFHTSATAPGDLTAIIWPEAVKDVPADALLCLTRNRLPMPSRLSLLRDFLPPHLPVVVGVR